MDLGRPIARHFARRPHESDDAVVSTPADDPARPQRDEQRRDQPVQGAVKPEQDTRSAGRTGP